MKKVLILGAGMVAKPIVRYLLDKGYAVTLADMFLEKAETIIAGHANGKAVKWKVEEEDKLDEMVAAHELTISILPWMYHLIVAKKCIKHKKNMVTTSYVKPELRELDKQVKDAGIIILNEVGLDPGIDHMSAKRIIDNIHKKGGKIEEFYSICGALPAPEATDNPFRYKFSWSPKGVVMASNNDAQFMKDGKVVEVKTENLFKHPFSVDYPEVGKLEVYPNRDSLSYIDIYGIPEVRTMYRGTFRHPGWCVSVNAMKKLKLLTTEKFNFKGKAYADLIAVMIGAKSIIDIRQKAADYLKMNYNTYSLKAMEWLGLFDNIQMNREEDSPFEIVSDLMISKMMLKNEERDMVVLQHNFTAKYDDGKREIIRSRMLDFGTLKTDTAIARTVALPAAIAAEMILTEKISLKGVHIPVLPELYNPILDNLEKMNIKMVEEYGLPLTERIA